MEKVKICHNFFVVAVIASAVGVFFDVIRVVYAGFFFVTSQNTINNSLVEIDKDSKYSGLGELLIDAIGFMAIVICIVIFILCIVFLALRVATLVISVKGMQFTDFTKNPVVDAAYKKRIKRSGVVLLILNAAGMLTMGLFGNPLATMSGSGGQVLLLFFMASGVLVGIAAFICNFVMGILVLANEPDVQEEMLENFEA